MISSQIVSILDDALGQTARLRKGGTQATYHCPMCPDKNLTTQKLEIAVDGPHVGNYHCWRCNFRGKSFGSLLSKLKAPVKYREQIHKLTGDIRVLKRTHSNVDDTLSLPEEFQSLSVPRVSFEYKNAMFYLKKRGISQEDILRYNIGYCESGPYENHIIIPSYDAEGKLNFFMEGNIITLRERSHTKSPKLP